MDFTGQSWLELTVYIYIILHTHWKCIFDMFLGHILGDLVSHIAEVS